MADSALAKVERASKHIEELSKLIREKRPFKYFLETNEKTGQCMTFAERDESVIGELSNTAFDAIQNLRAALDHAYWEIVNPFAKNDREKSALQFPFSKTEAQLDSAIRNRLADRVSQEFFNAILSLRPHGESGGNEALYAIHRIAADERHRFPTPVADYKELTGDMLRRQFPTFPLTVGRIGIGSCRIDLMWSIPSDPANGQIIKQEVDVSVDVVFANGQQRFKPMVHTLCAMIDETIEAIKIMRAAKSNAAVG